MEIKAMSNTNFAEMSEEDLRMMLLDNYDAIAHMQTADIDKIMHDIAQITSELDRKAELRKKHE